jgi:nucleoside-diphosphate-sugar epimerase
MTRVALTGGTGFIGANLARALLRRGDEVHLLVRANHATWRVEAIRNDIALHVVDIADARSVREAFRAIRPELLFHLAQAGGHAWHTDVPEMVATNYLACINLLRAAGECGTRVVNAGSSSEYGARAHATRETDSPRPNSDYAATKLASTLYCRHWAQRTMRPAPTLRLYSIYGPFEEPMRLLPRLVAFGLEGRLPPLTSPETARDFVYVDDAVAALLRAAEVALPDPGAIFNICSGRQITLREAVATAGTVLGVTEPPSWASMAPRAWDTGTWVGDPALAARDLGWTATTPLAAGIGKFAEWLNSEPAMREHYRRMTGADAPTPPSL